MFPCPTFLEKGKCGRGANCHYAHIDRNNKDKDENQTTDKKIKVESPGSNVETGTSNNVTATKKLPEEPVVKAKIEKNLLAFLRRRIAEQIVTNTNSEQLEPLGDYVPLSVFTTPEGDTEVMDGPNEGDPNSSIKLINELSSNNLNQNNSEKAKQTNRPPMRLERKPKTFVMDNEEMSWAEYLNNMAKGEVSEGVVSNRPALKIIPDYLMTDEVDEKRLARNETEFSLDEPMGENEELVDIMCDPLLDVALSSLGLLPSAAKLASSIVVNTNASDTLEAVNL